MSYLSERRKSIGRTQKEVADFVGVSEATVSRWESGDIANMRRDKIKRYAEILDTSTDFIMTGREHGDDLPDNLISMPRMNQVPLIGDIACGVPSLAEENIEEFVDLPEHIKADFALRCKGDSMINARIFDGDIVYIRANMRVESGQIAAVRIDNEATLKRVEIYEDHIVLMPENPQYRPLSYWGNDMNNVQIIGKAVAFTSAIK